MGILDFEFGTSSSSGNLLMLVCWKIHRINSILTGPELPNWDNELVALVLFLGHVSTETNIFNDIPHGKANHGQFYFWQKTKWALLSAHGYTWIYEDLHGLSCNHGASGRSHPFLTKAFHLHRKHCPPHRAEILFVTPVKVLELNPMFSLIASITLNIKKKISKTKHYNRPYWPYDAFWCFRMLFWQ